MVNCLCQYSHINVYQQTDNDVIMSMKAQYMSVSKQEEFIVWLDGELSRRGWSDYQLAKRAQISHSVISRARSGSLPKWGACESIARALGMPTEFVFRKAGLLPSKTYDEAEYEQVAHLFGQLPRDDRERVLAFLRTLAEMKGRPPAEGS